MAIDTAVVLAAGRGARLGPLTERRPKPMLPVANQPLLGHVIQALDWAGLERVVVVVGYQRERIQNHFGSGEDYDLTIEYAFQETQRGTGDALLQAESLVSSEFLVMNGDRIVTTDLLEDLIATYGRTEQFCMATTEVDDPTQYGMVELDGPTVGSLVEKPAAYEVTSNVVNAGVYAFGPEIFSAIRGTDHRGELALTDTITQHLDSHPVQAVRYHGPWLECSHPWDLLTVNDGLLGLAGGEISESARIDDQATVGDPVAVGDGATVRCGARLLRGTAIGENVRVGANAVLTNTIVFPDATIQPGTVLRDCIVGAGATVGPNVTAEGGYTDVRVDTRIHEDVKLGGVIGDGTAIGGNATVEPGTMVGNNVAVAADCTLGGKVQSEGSVYRG